MKRKYLASIIFSTVLLLIISSSPAEKVSDWEWQGVERVVAIGDIHGEYDSLVKLLVGLSLVGQDLKWSGGSAHLVLCGDLLDRGKKERALMDLLIRLQVESEEQGGKVHTLLGNHDVMNLIRDFRYVDPANFADFIKDEKARDRKKGWESFKKLYDGKGYKEGQIRAAFDLKYPPGYFGRSPAFELKGKYGSWLFDHPTMIKINDVVYVHAGVKETTAEMGISTINKNNKESIKNFNRYCEVVEPYVRGVAGYAEFWGTADAITKQASSGQVPRNLAEAARGILEENERLYSPNGPFWYRGNSLYNEFGELPIIQDSLELLGANTLVIGHTPTKTGKITARFDHQLYRTDVGIVYGRDPYALDMSEQGIRIFNPQASAYEDPKLEEDPRGEGISDIPEQLPEPQMKNFLLKAEIVSVTDEIRDDREYFVVTLKDEHSQRRAFFLSVAEKPSSDPEQKYFGFRHYKHDYAAYLLDRELGLGFIPTTVIRKVDGEVGSLQEWMENAWNLISLKERNINFGVFREMQFMISQVRLFWALLDVRENQDFLRMYVPEEKKVMFGDNSLAFSLSPEIQEDRLYPPAWAQEDMKKKNIEIPQFKLNPNFELALRSLEIGRLKELLGEYLSDEQIEALLKRKDALLERCSVEYQAEEKISK